MRIRFVEPGVDGGLPATITTTSPARPRPLASMASSTARTMSSVCATVGLMNVSTPQVSAICERTAGSGVNA